MRLPQGANFECRQDLRARLAPSTSEDEVPNRRDIIDAKPRGFIAKEVSLGFHAWLYEC